MSARTGIFFVLVCVLLAPVAAWAAEPGVTDTEVVVGVSTPLSGPAALWGVTALGMKAWADHINDQGGIQGRKITVIIKDDGYNPTRSMANLQEMKDQVFAICGLLGSAPCNASKDFFPENKIPLITAYANVRIYANQPKEKQHYYFIAYPDYEDENHFLADYAIRNLDTKTIAVFYQNDDYGHQALAGIKDALKANPGKAEIVAEVPYEVTERALGTHGLKLKESGADTVILVPTPTHAALITKEMAKIAYRPKVLTNFTMGDPIMFKIAGETWDGTYISLAGNMSQPGFSPEADKVVETLLKYNPDLKGKEYLAVFGAVSMMHFAKALENAGRDLTREGLIAGMEQIKDWKPEGMGAPVTYGPDRHHGINASQMGQAKDGKAVPIADFTVYAPRF
ncbi:MAG: ABC transporter substrate-binding protein [Deltaproteobacteria bacterium]|nr:ABC transporter substrate-binding protein [Deltaproteobacteria bacterium]